MNAAPRSPIRRALLPLAVLWATALAAPAGAADQRFGIGILYADATGDVVRDGMRLDDASVAGVLSYQYRPGGLFAFELDLELYPDGTGGAESFAAAPVAYLLFGKGLYAGLGVGVTISSDFGGSVSDPFFAARLGFNLKILPRMTLDVNANWRADAFNELDDPDVDAITLGASLRFTL
ncbi:MAG: hypothetical protein D6696_13090 [Acidobacteria bacterium]|nr:MAG: hypothetical protein D6696_13090 [Acidobacteriota bacterium]